MQMYGGADVWCHAAFGSILMVMCSQLHVPASLFLYPLEMGVSMGSSARHNYNDKISGPYRNQTPIIQLLV